MFFFISLCLGSQAFAQAQKATVINNGSFVYQDPNFDAPVISTLKAGGVFNISKGRNGPFYKIRLKPGTVGWIADTDVKPGVHKIQIEEKKSGPLDPPAPRVKSYLATRYRGLSLNYINYTEETLGSELSAMTPLIGVTFNGYNTVFDGDIYTEANLIFSWAPPSYYTDYTKRPAEGTIVIANFLFQTVLPRGKDSLFFYGFGPMFRYSHFVIEVFDGTRTSAYVADDMTVGAVFNVGLAFRLGDFSIRPDFKYYWEKDTYYGGALSLTYKF